VADRLAGLDRAMWQGTPRQYRGEIVAGAATPAREAPKPRAAVGTTRKPAMAMVTAVRSERIPITLLDDAAELAPHGSIRAQSERADAGLPELGEVGTVADRLAHREV